MRDTIRSRDDLARFLAADAAAHGHERTSLNALVRNHALRWQRTYRRVEWARNTWPRLLQPVAVAWQTRMHWQGAKLGFTLPLNVAGPGLCLVHWGTVVVSGEARLGADVRVHPGVSIGEHYGRAPVVEDHVRIGPGAKIVGGVRLGEGCQVGANAVVTRDVEPWRGAVGVPAKLLPLREGDARRATDQADDSASGQASEA